MQDLDALGIRRSQTGFTLMELVVVIIVIGLLVAVVTTGNSPLSASRQVNADVLKSAIRYAQSTAMKTGNPWGVAWSGSSYWLFDDGDAASTNAQAIPGETSLVVSLSARNVSISPGTYVISFNHAGQPFTNATGTSALGSDQTVTITATDDSSVSTSFIITEETGYLQ